MSPRAPAPPVPTAGPGLSTDQAGLIAYANLHYELAQQALKDGDFARYGQEIDLVGQALAQLHQLTGGSPIPSP